MENELGSIAPFAESSKGCMSCACPQGTFDINNIGICERVEEGCAVPCEVNGTTYQVIFIYDIFSSYL